MSAIIMIAGLLLFYTKNLQQGNREDIFLTTEGLTQLNKFKNEYGNRGIIVLKRDYNTITGKIVEDFINLKI